MSLRRIASSANDHAWRTRLQRVGVRTLIIAALSAIVVVVVVRSGTEDSTAPFAFGRRLLSNKTQHPFDKHIPSKIETKREAGFPGLHLKHREIKKSRGKLLYNHNPKAAGSFIRHALNKIIPGGCLVDEHDGTYTRAQIREAKCIIRNEFSSSSEEDQDNRFVIGSVREPCDHFLSLWSFGSGGRGSLHQQMLKTTNGKAIELYGQNKPFDSADDISRFRQWIRLRPLQGYQTARFLTSYSNNSAVDCFVVVEGANTRADFVRCLQQFMDQAPAVKDDVSKGLIDRFNAEIKPAVRKNTTPHASCSAYYDAATAAQLEKSERPLFEGFGWPKCCAPVASKKLPTPGSQEHWRNMLQT